MSEGTNSAAVTLSTKVAERIKACSPDVENLLVETLVAKEVSRRVEVIGQGLAKLDQMDRERFKLAKPTHVTYNADGSTASETFSKEALEGLKKHDEKREKLHKAVNAALAGNLKDLNGLLGSN